MRQVKIIIVLGLVATTASAPALAFAADSQSPDSAAIASPARDDPWQGFNRGGFAVHQFLDRHFLRPAALAYGWVLPKPVRDGLHNIFRNLNEPVVAANDIMQGRVKKASVTVVRFAANSTIGVAGVFDVATKMGAPHHDNSFALTLGRAHVKAGPFLFIPLVGPSTVRDIVGRIVDVGLDPLHWINYRNSLAISLGRGALSGLDTRLRADPDLKAVLADATDPYATLRSVYLQNQQSKIDGVDGDAPATLPNFDDPPSPAPAVAQPAPPVAVPAGSAAAPQALAEPPAAGTSPRDQTTAIRANDFKDRLLDETVLL